MTTRQCLGCGRRIENASRCRDCEQANWKRRRNTRTGWAWTAIRNQVLNRDRHQCRRCGQPATQVHHLQRLAAGGGNRLEGLVALCHACHHEMHGGAP